MLGIYHEAQRESPEIVYGVEEEYREGYRNEDKGTSVRQRRRVRDLFLQLYHNEGIERLFTVKKTPIKMG